MKVRWSPLAAAMALVLVLPGLALAAAGVEGNQLFAELPPQHWSYGAVRSLSAAGLLSEPPKGFGGPLTVTRLEMALEVGEAMERLGVGKAESRAVSLPSLVARYNQQADKPLGLEQMRLLEELAQEFSVELNVLGYTVIPSPQSLRLPEAAKQPAFPELDAVWIDLGQGGAFTWSPSAAPLPEASLTEGKLPSWLEPEPAEGSQGLALGARIRLLPSLSLEGEVAPWGESAGYRVGAGIDLGDVYISGGYDVPTRPGEAERGEGSRSDDGRTRWGLRWTAGDAELTAAYEFVTLDQLEVRGGAELPSRLELGVGVTTQGGAIRVGWSRELRDRLPVQSLAGGETAKGEPPDGETDGPDEGEGIPAGGQLAREVNTTWRLTYDLSSVASFTLGYQLIDFTAAAGETLEDGTTSETRAIAELTLRF